MTAEIRSHILILDATVVNPCAIRNGKVLRVPHSKQSFMRGHFVHVLRAGESMYSVSQKYGIRLKNLYKMNKMDADDPAPEVGTILRLR